MRTIFLLDFDGPINASDPGWSAAPYRNSIYDKNTRKFWPVRWAPQLVIRLWKLHANPRLIITWASSWCGSTDNIESTLKLPAFDSASDSRMSGSDKEKAAYNVIASGNRLIWADDEFVPTSGKLFEFLTENNNALLLKPKLRGNHSGLRPEHLDAVDKFMLGSNT